MDNKMKKRPHDRHWRGAHMESKAMPGREVADKRTANSKTFDLGRGCYQFVQYPDVVHFQDAEGKWQEIDNHLIEQKNIEGKPVLRNRQNSMSAEFAKRVGEAPLVAIRKKGGQQLQWTLRGEQSGIEAKIDTQVVCAEEDEDAKRADLSKVETSLTYEEILPNVDLVCRLQGTAFKDDIILKNANAPHKFVFDMELNGVDLHMQEDGTILGMEAQRASRKRVQKEAKKVFTLPAAFMRDNNGNIGEVKTELVQEKDKAEMILICDEEFLATAAFPVVVDPLVQTEEHSSNMEDNFVTSNSPNTVQGYASGRLRVCKNSSYGECRAFLKFTNLPYFMPCNMVTKAYLRMSLYSNSPTRAVPIYLKEVEEDWSSQTITWNNQPTIASKDTDVVVVPASVGTGSQFAFDISNLVRKWYSGANYGVAFERKITATPNTIEFGSSDSAYYKPVIMINYVSFAGIQNHLAYDTFDCGRAGAAHVNLYNGDVVIERPITKCGGNRMPVSLTAYFGYSHYGSTSRMGSHWRLSCDQGVYKENINDELHFVWCKGDGSRIYFKMPDDATDHYEDLSGLSLKLTDGTYTEIEDKQGNVMRFESPVYVGDDTGRILSITDACGNTNTFHYTGWYLSSITDGAGRVTTITRNEDNYITEILAPGETTPVRFFYTGFDLYMIDDVDGWSSQYSYDENGMMYEMLDMESWRLLYFFYENAEPYRAWNVYEMSWPEEEKIMGKDHTYSYYDMMTKVTDYSGDKLIRMYYQFNDFGNVVCVRDELGYASYSKFSDALLPNHPEQVSKLQRSVINLLPDHDFETGGYWSTALNGGTGTFSYATDQKYLGSKAMKMVKTNADGNMCVYMNYANLKVGQSYTLSGYIRSTGSVAGYAAVYHGENWFNGAQITPGSEWTRVSATFTATSTSAVLYFIAVGTGTLWLDAAQFEEGSVANRYNLIRNGDFSQNSSGVPTFWTANGSNDSDDEIIVTDDELHPDFLSGNVMRLYGDPQTNKGIYQDLPISGSEGDVFVASGWAHGYSRPIGDDPRHFGIRVAFKNSSGTRENGEVLSWNEEWTDWQYVSGAVIAPCNYTEIRFNVDYEENVNYADFDGFTLYKEEFGNTFAYDEDGNVTAVKNLASKQAKAEYDDYNNLLSYVQPGREETVKTVLTYGDNNSEKKMRLPRSITSPSGIYYAKNYDSMGNLKRDSVIDNVYGDDEIETRMTYTSDGNHVATKTDSRGKVMTYVTDLAKDTLTSVTEPNGQTVSYVYDEQKQVTSATAVMGDQVFKNEYTYDDRRLKTISHNTTSATPDVIYTFEYDEFGNPTTVSVGTQELSRNVYSSTGDRTLTRVEYGNGGKVHYTRDDFRRITGIHFDDDTAPRFTYDYGANGQVAYVHDNENHQTEWTEYDSSERPIRTHLMENATSTSIGTPKYVRTVTYDEFGNTSSYKERIGTNTAYETTYTHDVENRLTQMRYGADNRMLTYEYDRVGRVKKRIAVGAANYATTYSYLRPNSDEPYLSTPLVESIVQTGQNFSYTYDDAGNISSMTRNGVTTTYAYDTLGQLLRVNDPSANKTTIYSYDMGGNIVSCTEYTYTTGAVGAATKNISYLYGDSNWKDKLTSIDGKTITYDQIGNPLTFDGWTFSWKTGRMLSGMSNANNSIQYVYDHNGMRTKKTVNGVATNYILSDKSIVHLEQAGNVLHFFYDAQGKPAMVRFNGTDYFYVYNLQGDVVAIVDTNASQVVEYTYDAWGVALSKTGSLATTLGTLNPFRYHAYVYDEETGLYYLKNRYYNPNWRRFINTDGLVGDTEDILNKAQFTYCMNNPVMLSDDDGNWPDWGKLFSGTTLLAMGLTAVAAGLSVVTCGAAAPVMVYAATAVMAAGTVSAINGASEMIESSTDFNLMRDVVYLGNQELYDGQRDVAALVAETGTCAISLCSFVHPVCFVAGTQVLAEHEKKPIELIEVGDFVWAANPETGERALKCVSRTFLNKADELVHVQVNGETITCTTEHPFYVRDRGWVAAGELVASDKLELQNGRFAYVESIEFEKIEEPIDVYNFEVEGFHTYFVGDNSILVHNQCKNPGRQGKQARLREIMSDDKVASHIRGELKRDNNCIIRGTRRTLRVPSGYDLSHRIGYSAKDGFGYAYSDLNMRAQHRLHHKLFKY